MSITNLSPINLETLGFDSRYIMYPQGYVYNTRTYKNMCLYQHQFHLRRLDGRYQTISLKALYRQCYGLEYCLDNIEDIPGEEWRQVVVDKETDATGYLVSNLGRIKSLKGYQAKILKQDEWKNYKIVCISNTRFRVHRLVALAFIPNNDKSKNTVDHINGNTRDNRASNLQWLSILDNINKGWEERRQDKKGIQSGTTQSL